MKDLKQSTKQSFTAFEFDYPDGYGTDKPFNRTSRSIDISNRLRTPSEP